ESIINNLSQLPKLRVMARSTVFRYKGRSVDPQKIGHDLNVDAVLTGNLAQENDRLVIKTELVKVSDGSQLWGQKYSRRISEIFPIQDEISQEIVEKLSVKLTGEEQKLLTKRYTEDTDAYQLYLRGQYYLNKRTSEGINKAAYYFQQAIDKDPGYALAY